MAGRAIKKASKAKRVLQRKKAISYDPSQLRRAFLERLGLSGVSRVFFISYYQVFRALNLVCLLLPDFRSQVNTCPPSRSVLQFDALCSFCGRKKDKQWLWAALCQNTRQIVAYVIGDRSEATFRRLLRKIPVEYLRGQSYSDHWKSYRILLSKGNHQQVGKESGKTNHIERWNATLRARISRYVRKSLSFSGKLKYHHLVTKLFIVDYNQSCINTF